MSRASFAQRFSELVGTTPIEYLTRWRMTQAELLLRNPQISVANAAERVGYETEAAFRKAFKRVHGVGPGSIRRWFRERLGNTAR
ncbi:MAG: helix-turn-helix transcriptional regulator [Sinimarinibacterium sp.]|jgi:AraC-like DNA-binding protein